MEGQIRQTCKEKNKLYFREISKIKAVKKEMIKKKNQGKYNSQRMGKKSKISDQR